MVELVNIKRKMAWKFILKNKRLPGVIRTTVVHPYNRMLFSDKQE